VLLCSIHELVVYVSVDAPL